MRRGAILVFAVLLLGIAAVGGCARDEAGPATGSSAAVDPLEGARQYAKCMREHGVEMQDPGAGGDIAGSSGSREAFEAAAEVCRQYAPAGTGDLGGFGQADPAQVEANRRFAQCMRENGVNMRDPEADGTWRGSVGSGSNGGSGMDLARPGVEGPVDEATYQAAMDKCDQHLASNSGHQ